MLSFSGSLKVYVAVEACDMRKGFNGLYAAVSERLGEDPRDGTLFVFSNRRHNGQKWIVSIKSASSHHHKILQHRTRAVFFSPRIRQ